MTDEICAKYPIDVTKLNKGDIIKADYIEKTYNIDRFNWLYGRDAILKLKAFIEKRSQELEIPLLACSKYPDLRILTDDEAVAYSRKEFEQGMRKSRKAHRKSRLIDIDNLSEPLKRQLSNQQLSQSMQLAAISKTKSIIRTEIKKLSTSEPLT